MSAVHVVRNAALTGLAGAAAVLTALGGVPRPSLALGPAVVVAALVAATVLAWEDLAAVGRPANRVGRA